MAPKHTSAAILVLQIKNLILKPQLLKEAAEKLTEEQRRCMWPPEIGHQYHHYLTREFDRTQLAAIEVGICHPPCA